MMSNDQYKTGWYTYPSENHESIGMMTFPIYGTIKNVPVTTSQMMIHIPVTGNVLKKISQHVFLDSIKKNAKCSKVSVDA